MLSFLQQSSAISMLMAHENIPRQLEGAGKLILLRRAPQNTQQIVLSFQLSDVLQQAPTYRGDFTLSADMMTCAYYAAFTAGALATPRVQTLIKVAICNRAAPNGKRALHQPLSDVCSIISRDKFLAFLSLCLKQVAVGTYPLGLSCFDILRLAPARSFEKVVLVSLTVLPHFMPVIWTTLWLNCHALRSTEPWSQPSMLLHRLP
jgi:hypothetical protein